VGLEVPCIDLALVCKGEEVEAEILVFSQAVVYELVEFFFVALLVGVYVPPFELLLPSVADSPLANRLQRLVALALELKNTL
jgi:hypothetical protein